MPIHKDKFFSYSLHKGRAGKLLIIVEPALKVSVTSVWFRAGSRFDPDGKEGLAHFFEHLVSQRTKLHPEKINRLFALEKNGIDFFAYTNKELAYFYHLQSPEKTLESLCILAEGVQNTIFSDDDLKRERSVIMNEAEERRLNPNLCIFEILYPHLFPKTDFAKNIFGSSETLHSINAQDIDAFRKKHYSMRQAHWIVLVPKAEDIDKMVRALEEGIVLSNEESFHEEKENNFSLALEGESKAVFVQESAVRPIDPVLVSMNFRIPGLTDRSSALMAHFVRSIIASGWSSLLNRSLRVQHQLIYWTTGTLVHFREAGFLGFTFYPKKESLQASLDVARSEIYGLAANLLHQEEFLLHKAVFKTRFLRTYSDVEELLWWYGSQDLLGGELPVISPEEALRCIENISPESVRKFAETFLMPDNECTVVLS